MVLKQLENLTKPNIKGKSRAKAGVVCEV